MVGLGLKADFDGVKRVFDYFSNDTCGLADVLDERCTRSVTGNLLTDPQIISFRASTPCLISEALSFATIKTLWASRVDMICLSADSVIDVVCSLSNTGTDMAVL